jgi:dephospho-CoA kinase
MSSAGARLVIGIAGGIGSGKTTVARMLAERGACVIDADAIGHRLLEAPKVKNALAGSWGRQILDEAGNIDRSRLAHQVFANRQNLAQLNALVHPLLLKELRGELERRRTANDCSVLVIDAALLLEWGLDTICEKIIFVRANLKLRQTRVQGERRWQADELARREKLQLPLSEKEARAAYFIDNSGTIAQTRKQVEELWQVLSTLAATKNKGLITGSRVSSREGRIGQGG